MNFRAIIILSVISFVPLCSAMEIPTKNSRIKVLSFSKNDTIIIAGDHCCEVYSTKTGMSSILSDDDNDCSHQDPIFDMAISPNNKKLALVKAKKIVLYDITGDIKKEKEFEQELHFGWDHQISWSNDQLNICYENNYPYIVCKYHSITQELSQYQRDPRQFNAPIMVEGTRHPIIITDLDNMREKEHERMGNFKLHLLPYTYSERFPQGEFNYDGTWLAINMCGKKYRFLLKGNQKIDEFEISSEEKNKNDDIFYIAIAFHKNDITAALLRNDGCIEFWDYKKKRLLLKLLHYRTDEKMLWKDRNNRDQLLCFSPDYESMIASVGRKIDRCGVPRTAICIQDTGQRCYALFCGLKNYSMKIPKEIIWSIMDTFLWCSELVHEKKVNEIIRKNQSKIAAWALANQKAISDEESTVDEDQEIVSDEEKDDFYTCTCQMKKMYARALVAVLAGVAALYAFV